MTKAESDASNNLFLEFLGDYFAECDDHLRLVRQNLLRLENYVDEPRIDRTLLDELFRSFHSLKGISGMVGLREAEQLAHVMESYLRALRDRTVTLNTNGVDALMAGARLLEEVIGEFRAKTSIRDISTVVAQIARVTPEDSRSSSASLEIATVNNADAQPPGANNSLMANGSKVWRFRFIPSIALSQRGVNVNTLRERLQEIGELLKSSPCTMDHGGIAFEFLVATEHGETSFEGWSDDGVTFEEYQDPFPAIPAPGVPSEAAVHISASTATFATSNVVRVDLGRLDDLMRMVGDLVVSRSRLDDALNRLESTLPAAHWRPLQETNFTMERQLRDLREGIVSVRMVPIGEIFERMQFAVRDLAREFEKTVRVQLHGQHTEIDKLLVERMMDPILHLVRNAVSHGLESRAERIASGKPPEGRIVLRAYTASQMVMVEIEDDGRGIDADQVEKRAVAMNLIASDVRIDPATMLDLICAPGFSTREKADRASGRGVGMAVVKNTVAGLGGSMELQTEVGLRTRITIQLPLTLAIADALIVAAGGQRFAVPQSTVVEVLEIEAAAVKAFENNEIISHRGGVLPLLRLARLFQLEQSAQEYLHVFVVGAGSSSAGIVVDRILGHREIVVRAVNDPLVQVRGIAGATELGDGRVVLILDAVDLIRSAQAPMRRPQLTL